MFKMFKISREGGLWIDKSGAVELETLMFLCGSL